MTNKEIKNYEYTAISPDGKEVKENLVLVLTKLLAFASQTENINGVDQFKQYGIYSEAFQKAEETGIIELSNENYNSLKTIVENYVPAIWGMNTNIHKGINLFLNA